MVDFWRHSFLQKAALDLIVENNLDCVGEFEKLRKIIVF